MEQRYSLKMPFQALEKALTSVLTGKYWQVKLGIIALALSAGSLLFFNSIFIDKGFRSLYYEILAPGSQGGLFWDDIIAQGQDPFAANTYEPGTHEANQTFRLTIPFIARFLGLNVAGLYGIHVLLGLIFTGVVIRISYEIVQDKIQTFYFVTGFLSVYAGANFYINYLGHADIFAFSFLLLAIYLKKPTWVFLFSFLAFWCDERAIINSTYSGIWILMPFIANLQNSNKWEWSLIPASIYSLIAAGIIYVLIRKWMEIDLGMFIGHDNSLSQKTSLWSLSIFGDKFTRGFEGMWFIFFAAIALLIMSRQWLFLVLFGGSILITLVIMVMIADGTRAVSYGFIGLFIALRLLKNKIPDQELKYLLVVSTAVSLMLPISFP